MQPPTDTVPAEVRRQMSDALRGLAHAIDEGQANPDPMIGEALRVWHFSGHAQPKAANGGLAVSVSVTAAQAVAR